MSKLAHSNDETMRQIERDRLIADEGWKICERCEGSGSIPGKVSMPWGIVEVTGVTQVCPVCDGNGAMERRSLMTDTTHTVGPLVFDAEQPGNVYSDDATGSIVATCFGFQYAPRPRTETDANARRLVACWNACEGIPTEALEGGVVEAMSDALKVSKIELAALLPNPDEPDWMSALSAANPGDAECLQKAFTVICDALTDAKGESP